ncbi:hypothetical protein [Halorarius halobius]|uniref:hypothetical protein n=1 Tax=Halorarius halobius TaxID=2962671 RepID=UPI0020CDEF81|nr:hypothetical protein [Halorarius halobius]
MTDSPVNSLAGLAKHTVSEVVVAYLVAFIASGGDPLTLGRVLLAVKLNLFAVPLSWTPVLRLPPWAWYVVAVLWIRQWLYLSQYTTADIVREVEAGVAGITARWSA